MKYRPFLYEIPADIAARPDLLDAARATVRARLRWLESEENDGEMAFGLAMPGWAAAHLGMAQEAERLVLRMARSYVLPSMVTTHNIRDLLNVDIGGGFPALIAEMLVQSSRGWVALLPALPRRWRRDASPICTAAGRWSCPSSAGTATVSRRC